VIFFEVHDNVCKIVSLDIFTDDGL